MTDARIVRIPPDAKLPARALYDGFICAVDPGVDPDKKGAVSVMFAEGPLDGETRWLQPEWLEPWRSEPNTGGDW